MGLINEAYQTPFSRYPATAISLWWTIHRRIRNKRAVFVRRVRAKAVFDIVIDACIGIISVFAACDACIVIVGGFALIIIRRHPVFWGGRIFFCTCGEGTDACECADDTHDAADNFRDVLHGFTCRGDYGAIGPYSVASGGP